MKLKVAVLTALFATIALARTASAEQWKHTIEFKYAKTSSIRIVEPEGFKVTVDGREDTVPAVFNFGNQANYYRVQVTAKDGQTWTKKIEVKAHSETVLRVSYSPKTKGPSKPAGKKAQTYIGKAQNKCRSKTALRYEFLLGGEAKADARLAPRQIQDLKLPAGSYKVRVYNAGTRSKKWNYVNTFDHKVKSDGWVFAPRC